MFHADRLCGRPPPLRPKEEPMGRLPIFSDETAVDAPVRRRCLRADNLPLNYMADYSVLGLRVSRLAAAVDLLKAHGYALIDTGNGTDVVIDRAGGLPQILHLLSQHRIDAGLSDIADQIYQG
jgi:hypothetical protein